MIQIIVSCLRNTFSYIFFASFSYLTHCVRNKGMSFQARRGFARLQCMLYLCKENFSQKRWFGAGKDWKCSSKHYWSLESLFFFLSYRIVDAVFNQTAIKIIRHVHSNQNWRKLQHHSVGLKSVYRLKRLRLWMRVDASIWLNRTTQAFTRFSSQWT